MTQKAIIFDASTLISFSMNGLFDEIKELKEIFSGKFLITKEVKNEIIDKPLNIKRFELEALNLQELLDEKVLELPESLGVSSSEITSSTFKILEISNNTFIGNKKSIHIIDIGEASCLALSRILNNREIENVLAIDERTTRILIEKPENLKKLFQERLHTRIEIRTENLTFFKGFKVIRSTELIYIAWKKGLINLKGKNVLDAMLYALKFKGASISEQEIQEIKRIG